MFISMVKLELVKQYAYYVVLYNTLNKIMPDLKSFIQVKLMNNLQTLLRILK